MLSCTKPRRPKKCSVCKACFSPFQSLQKVCSVQCAIEAARKAHKLLDARKLRADKEAIKTRSEWIQQAQRVFNAYIRKRDAGLPCISCGTLNPLAWHAGHYRSTGAAPHLRFNPDNIHAQCSACNTHLSGNLVMYRRGLIDRIGIDRVERLENDNAVKKWTIDELKGVIAQFKAAKKVL